MVPIDVKKKKSCLRWFDNLQRRAIDTPMKKSDWIQFKQMKRGRRRHKTTIVIVKMTC